MAEKQGIPLDWYIPDDMIARYATNMVVQQLENEFLISFFEVKPPIIFGEPGHIQEQLDEMPSIRANCVAQIIVSKQKLPTIIKAMEANLKRLIESEDIEE